MMAHIREMTIADYEQVIALMRRTAGIAVRDADSREATERYLARNPGLSLVAEDRGRVIGCVLCGHDGRRGYLQHLAVAPPFRRQGIAQTMVSLCLERLESLGITKTHIDVFVTNEPAIRYWTRRGWRRRDEICRFSFIRSGDADA